MKAFYSYPYSEREIRQVIAGAKSIVATVHRDLKLHLWEESDISGRPLTDPIFEDIREADILIADITFINFNVTFEIGYAIGLGKRVHLTRNSNFQKDSNLMDKIGVFDTLGFEDYTDQESLANLIGAFGDNKPIEIRLLLNAKKPVYFLRTPKSNAGMVAITSRIKKARLGFGGFTPSDDPRLSAIKAIDDIAASFGAVIPLLPSSFSDSAVHNIRAAFLAGLSLAMDKITLILQPRDGPAPLDVRDLVKTYSDEKDISEAIASFALDITEGLQIDDPLPVPTGNFLSELSIGDSVAENELQSLGNYYLRTDEYKRASRGEVNMVVGRKGTGKTALFSQLRNEKRNNRRNIVVDLKPEGYQLQRLKENVLDYLAEGARNHLITALFEYVFLLEISYKVLEKDHSVHKRDNRLYDPYQNLLTMYESGDAGEGDFSERLLIISNNLARSFSSKFGEETDQRLTATQVTELIYKHNIRDLRKVLSSYLFFKDSIWVLFDNLDKGWSAQGLTSNDIVILRCLIDAARKIQHQMQAEEHDFNCLVFVRNDVYQLLVENSSDYGKESRAVLDWSDSDLLRELIRMRLVQEPLPVDTSFDRVWAKVCVSHYQGEETSQSLIDRSLMRPRNLIKLIGHCRGFAVGLGHERIEEADIEKGLRAYSLDLITDADQELSDILGHETNLIYYFIGEGSNFSRDQLEKILLSADIAKEMTDQVTEFMLYYGFLGVKSKDEGVTYIFDVGYDAKLLKVLVAKAGDNLTYVLNPAFEAGLN